MSHLLLLPLSFLLLIALKRLVYDDRPLPFHHRLPKRYYEETPRRRFLLTGCASGVGKHLTGVLLSKGHLVVATDVNLEGLVIAAKDWPHPENVRLHKLDVSKREDWERVVNEANDFGAFEVLFNIAGYLRPAKMQTVTERDVNLHVDVNLKGVMHGVAVMGQAMVQWVANGTLPRGGHIVNFASLGAIAPVQGVTMYIATKAGCRMLSLCASKDLFEDGVYCTVVMPDAIQTPMVDLQLHHTESAMAYSGGILTVEDVERVIMTHVLPDRPREVMIGTSWLREKGARFNDIFGGSWLIAQVEAMMRAKGIRAQERVRAAMMRTTKSTTSSAHRSKSPSSSGSRTKRRNR